VLPALGNIQAGKLRAIAVTSKKRFSLLPDVPAFDESGLPNFEAVLHYGLLAPAEYAADIDVEETKWSGLVRKLNLKVE
jgi:tripartite-type tricarboxylate transporter receptor subunit TctC